jgi:predicted ATPase
MIERIIIENFKSIRKLDLELKPINILVGANGAGKSNFLSFFKFTNLLYNESFNRYVGNNISKFLYFGRKKSKSFSGLFDISNQVTVHFTVAPAFHSSFGTLQELNVRVNTKNNKDKNYEQWELAFKEENRNESRLSELEFSETDSVKEQFDSFRLYHFQDATEESKIKQPSKINDNRFLRENGENLASFLYLLQEKYQKDFRNIENQIRSVAPFFNRFDLEPDKLKDNEIELRWSEKKSEDYFNAYDLSDGTLRFMALTTLLMQPDLPKTIIIDEPELGLHPFAINKLAAMMKQAAAKGSQVIVSTQSVGLIDNFEPEDIITVDREDNQSVFKHLNLKELEGWLEDYTLGELWNKNIIGAMP